MPDIMVLGLDEDNLEVLRQLPHGDYRFHGLLEPEQLFGVDDLDLSALLEEAEERLARFPGEFDAIVGYWDFPVSSLVPILCARHGLISARLESVVKCEHKYWSRLEQQKVVDDHPAFALIQLDQPDGGERLPEGVDYPVWLKPIKSMSSELAFRVPDAAGLGPALAEVRNGVDRLGAPFQFVLDQLDLPDEIDSIGGSAALVEEAATGMQVTVEGYEHDGEIHVYAIIDSLTYPNSASFLRYQYPCALSEEMQERLAVSARRIIEQVGLTSATFNIEYLWDAEEDRLAVVEVNPRHSQSHAWMFEQVDGIANHEAMVSLALGRSPVVAHREGPFEVAAKCFHRHFSDGVVASGPSAADVERIEREVDGVRVEVVAGEGDRLADLTQQGSYSYELAVVDVAAQAEPELEEKFQRCVEMLGYVIEDIDEDAPDS